MTDTTNQKSHFFGDILGFMPEYEHSVGFSGKLFAKINFTQKSP
ncbi:MAG: hypothetical protein Q8T08_00925 [Ignavibacteria bacterium]|nr:hypothetical protein [Ignavibacteria bacterium]